MAKETTYEEIARELKNRIYKPVYYLMGEESYYIDRISEYIAQTVLNENEKEFNQTIVYGADTDIATVINAAKRYPMMSKYQVVIVKEAQNIKNIEVFVFCFSVISFESSEHKSEFCECGIKNLGYVNGFSYNIGIFVY